MCVYSFFVILSLLCGSLVKSSLVSLCLTSTPYFIGAETPLTLAMGKKKPTQPTPTAVTPPPGGSGSLHSPSASASGDGSVDQSERQAPPVNNDALLLLVQQMNEQNRRADEREQRWRQEVLERENLHRVEAAEDRRRVEEDRRVDRAEARQEADEQRQMMMEFMARQQQPNANGPSVIVQLPLPRTFNGDEDKDEITFDDWIHQVQTYARQSGQPELTVIDRVIEGNARVQFQSLQPAERATLELVVQNLRPLVSPVTSPTAAALQLTDLKQKHDESVGDLANRFQSLLNKVGDDKFTTRAAWLLALKPKIREKVMSRLGRDKDGWDLRQVQGLTVDVEHTMLESVSQPHVSFKGNGAGVKQANGNGQVSRKVTCYTCQKEGHISRDCPDKPKTKPTRRIRIVREEKKSVNCLYSLRHLGLSLSLCDKESLTTDAIIDTGTDVCLLPSVLYGKLLKLNLAVYDGRGSLVSPLGGPCEVPACIVQVRLQKEGMKNKFGPSIPVRFAIYDGDEVLLNPVSARALGLIVRVALDPFAMDACHVEVAGDTLDSGVEQKSVERARQDGQSSANSNRLSQPGYGQRMVPVVASQVACDVDGVEQSPVVEDCVSGVHKIHMVDDTSQANDSQLLGSKEVCTEDSGRPPDQEQWRILQDEVCVVLGNDNSLDRVSVGSCKGSTWTLVTPKRRKGRHKPDSSPFKPCSRSIKPEGALKKNACDL